MKVLLIGPFPFPINGCSYANKILLQNLEAQSVGHQIIDTNTSVISSHQGNKFSIAKSFAFIPVYSKSFKVLSSDVVYLTPGQTFFGILKYAPFILLCILFSKPYVIHVHGNYLGTQYKLLIGIKKKIFHFLLSKAAAGIVLSKSLIKNFEGLLSPEKVYIVENFADDSLYLPPVIQKQTDKLRVIYLSNLMKDKGIFDVLDALIILDRENIDFDATIAGYIEPEIKHEIDERLTKLNGKVQYVNTITGESKKQKLLQSNVFILPTYYNMEGQPISLLEGLATGNIIITTNHAGIPDIITTGNGYLVEPKSPMQIADYLKEINKDIPAHINRFSSYNRSYAQGNFTEKKFSEKIMAIFAQLTK